MRALNPGGDQRLLPYKCNQWRSPDVSLLRVIGLTFCKKKKKVPCLFTRASLSALSCVICKCIPVNPCSSTCRPLHIAARNGLATVVQVLLSRGAAVMAVDEEGKQ